MFYAIKKDFPNFPEEVISQWLEPFAIDLGWPPRHQRWKNIFGSPILFWKTVKWKRKEIRFEAIELTRSSRSAIDGMYQGFYFNIENDYKRSMFSDDVGKRRYGRIIEYLLKQGKLPRPLVLLEKESQYEIVDGNRRYLARERIPHMRKTFFNLPEQERMVYLGKLGIDQFTPLEENVEAWIAYVVE